MSPKDPEHKRRYALMILGGVALLGLLGTAALLGLFATAMQPEAEVPQAERADSRVPGAPAPLAPPGDRTFEVSGEVVDSHGDAMPDIQLRAESGDQSWTAHTDAFGVFRLDLDRPARIELRRELAIPQEVAVDGPTTGLLFTLVERCPMDVAVVDGRGAPIPGAAVKARVHGDGFVRQRQEGWTTDTDGRVRMTHLSCAIVDLTASADEHPSADRDGVDTTVVDEVRIVLPDGITLQGTVSDPSGEPIEDAWVRAGGQGGSTDARGHYELLVEPAQVRSVHASADGYHSDGDRLRLATGEPGPVTHDLLLEPAHRVTVHCSGLPDDSCASVTPVMCTRSFLPFGALCDTGPTTTCDCPAGLAAIRGGGATASVAPGIDEVWLDLREDGGIEGTVTLDDQPTACQVIATRVPGSLADLKTGLGAVRVGDCDAGGGFRMVGMPPGGWAVEVVAGGLRKTFARQHIEDFVVDLGVVAMGSGGVIEGWVLDGLTGEPAVGEPVIAVANADPKNPSPSMGQAASGPGGHFTIRGLDDGGYDVILAMRPFEKQQATVIEGRGTEEVVLTTSGQGLLGEQGFGVQTDADGSLVVGEVDPDGLAAGAGLRDGDVIDSVTFMGIDPADFLGEAAPLFTDFVLDKLGGTGIGLVVERDGELVEVDLE